jgi:beta-N-acetylhexosaminidase
VAEDAEARAQAWDELFMLGFHESDPEALTAQFREQGTPGGIIYFSRNAVAPGEIREMNRQVQAAFADHAHPPAPLLIAVDQEGGTVARLTDGFSVFPSNMAFGAVYAASPQRGQDLCFKAALATARELRDAGFNMNLAPCLDVNTNPHNPVIGTRSYSDRTEVVAALGQAAIRGTAGGGVLAVAKHFPGHGDTSVDSHTGMPVEDWDDAYDATHAEPFRRAIAAGVPAIMASHVGFHHDTCCGPKTIPATLSSLLLTGALRNRMGHDGLILTDCMEMGAISSTYGVEKASVMAIEAGVDMVLISHTPGLQRAAMRALADHYPGGALSRQVERVRRARKKVAAWRGCPRTPDMPSHDALVREAARASITLLEKRFDPAVVGGPPLVVAPSRYGSSTVAGLHDSPVARMVKRAIPGASVELYGASPQASEALRLSEEAKRSPWVVFVASNLHLNSGQAALAQAILEANPSLVVMDIATPCSIMAVPAAPYVICSYGYAPCQISAAIEVMMGARAPEGRLPVDVPGRFRFGHGLKG